MKIAVKTLKFLCAAAFAFAPSFSTAFANSGGGKLKVHALTTAEMQREYGAGGGGGGSTPTPAPGGGGGTTCGNIMSNQSGCSLGTYGSPTSVEYFNDTGSSFVTYFDAITSTSSTLTFPANCSIQITNTSISVGQSYVEGTATFGQTCDLTVTYNASAPIGYRVQIFAKHMVQTKTVYQTVAWYRNGYIVSYYGSSVSSTMTRKYDAYYQGSSFKI